MAAGVNAATPRLVQGRSRDPRGRGGKLPRRHLVVTATAQLKRGARTGLHSGATLTPAATPAVAAAPLTAVRPIISTPLRVRVRG